MRKRKSESTELSPLTKTLSKRKEIGRRSYTVPELIKLTERTRRQLVYWEDIGLLKPKFRDSNASGSKPRAFYSAREVVKALIVCDMLDRGLSLQQVQRVIRNLEKLNVRLEESEGYLITDGDTAIYAESDKTAIDILKHEGQIMLVHILEQVEKLVRAA